MSFAWPPSVVFTKTVAGSVITFNVVVKDKNNVQVGPSTNYTFDQTVDNPMTSLHQILSNAVFQVDQNIAWSDIPASGTMAIPIVDVIEQSN